MKKLAAACGLLSVILGSLAAQTFRPEAYEEETLSGFTAWRESYVGEEPWKFKIPALYSSGDDGSILFRDPSLEGEITFDVKNPWPRMTSGQKVTLYVTAQGRWVWDRQLDAVDYGNGRLVQAGGIEVLAQGGTRETAPPENKPAQRTGVPVISPGPDEIASSREAPQEGGAGIDYGRAPRVGSPQRVVVKIAGRAPVDGRYYRLQVGAYSVSGNASRAAENLKRAGLSPSFERYQNYIRVVLPKIPGREVVETAQKIGGAGFSDIWCREEP
jgi:hypothetical protein